MYNSYAYYAVAVDGAMLASRDFGFMLVQGFVTLVVQYKLLQSPRFCTSLSAIFATFTLRLASYTVMAAIRAAVLGKGRLGRALRAGPAYEEAVEV